VVEGVGPDSTHIPTHAAEQVFCFDTDGLLRRLDYTVDVNANATERDRGALHRQPEDLRRTRLPDPPWVFPRRPDGTPDRGLPGPDGSATALDLHDITVV
jgi:hypothetical protein